MADFTPTAVSKSSNFVTGSGGNKTSEIFSDLLANRTEIYRLITGIAEQFFGSTPPSNPNTGMIWRDSTNSLTKRWSGSAWEVDLATALSLTARNAILQGNVDASGNPALFEAGSGLACKLNATATPMIATWMNGNDGIGGEKNKLGIVSTDSATFWSSLPQSSTVYLYVELDGSTIQGGYSTLAPVYQYHAPSHSAGLDWVDGNKGFCYNSNGAAWTQKYRVYVGTATTDTTSETAVSVYPYNIGKLQSDVEKNKVVGFTLSVLPAGGLVSPIFVAPCAMTVQSIVITSRTSAGAAQAPSSSTNAVLYKDTTSFDSRAFTTADTAFTGLTLAVAAGDKLNLRVSANNTSGGIVSVTYKGVRA